MYIIKSLKNIHTIIQHNVTKIKERYVNDRGCNE